MPGQVEAAPHGERLQLRLAGRADERRVGHEKLDVLAQPHRPVHLRLAVLIHSACQLGYGDAAQLRR
jgi:hypothetical protein